MATAPRAAPRASSARSPPRAAGARSRAARVLASRSAPPRRSRASRVSPRAGAGEDLARYDAQAKEDDARQYGVWGVDGIRQRSASFAAMQEDWEDAVLNVWLSHGAGEVAAQRLLILGAKWQKGPQGELYRDAEAVAYAVRVLTELLPGADAPVIFHKTPSLALLCLNRHELSRRLVGIREGARRIPPLDVAATLNKDPRVVTSSDDARCIRDTTRDVVDAVIASVGFVLDEQGVASVIETCPSILTAHRDDVADAFAGYKTELKTRLDGVKGWSSALLFALDEEETSEKTRTKSSEINEKNADDDDECEALIERPSKWCSCWSSLGEDAREAATRASVDYAGRVVEPFLRRADVERERRKKNPNDADAHPDAR